MTIENIALVLLVRAHLLEDKRLAGQTIDVTSSGGYIQLVGCVDTEEQKQLAVFLASGIVGVRHVENLIKVRVRTVTTAEAA